MLVRQIGMGLIVVGGLLTVLCAQSAYAADPPEKGAAEKAKSETSESTDEAPDRYAVPDDADVKGLLAFIKSVRDFRPTSPQQRREHRVKSGAVIKAAAERIHEIASEQDKSLEGYGDAMDLLLYLRARTIRLATDEEKEKLIDEVRAALQSSPEPTTNLLRAAQSVATVFEYGGQPERAVELYREFGRILAKSPDAQIAHRGASMEGAARRLTLVGNPLELHGTLVDGGTFDWGSYRGRVVLVDFWATWCGPCLREIPNVKKNYEAFHDKGFEVVAVSLDDDRAKLDKFLEENPKPWANLHDGGWSENDVATYYGIMGIPTVILVDKDGKVVSTRARGPELGRLLVELLGPAKPKETDDDAAEKGQVKESG